MEPSGDESDQEQARHGQAHGLMQADHGFLEWRVVLDKPRPRVAAEPHEHETHGQDPVDQAGGDVVAGSGGRVRAFPWLNPAGIREAGSEWDKPPRTTQDDPEVVPRPCKRKAPGMTPTRGHRAGR